MPAGLDPRRETEELSFDEKTFWVHLEFRIGSELAGVLDGRWNYVWCDGFDPQRYLLDQTPPEIRGRVWIVFGQDQENWEFSLYLPDSHRCREIIDWKALIPRSGMTCWIAVDRKRKRLEVEPSAAVPDLPL